MERSNDIGLAPASDSGEKRVPQINGLNGGPPAVKQDLSTDNATDGENNTAPPPPPDGGYGWVCTACVATINAHTWGMNSSYGVFLAHYLENDLFPGATSLDYALVGSLSLSCGLLVSPIVTLSIRRFGTKPTMLVGVVLESASLICASWATQVWQLYLTQGVAFGVGMGFLFVASVPIVPQWFSTRRSLANGFSTCGSGLGGLVYSFASGAMIQNLGLPWTFRILGMIAFAANLVCVALIKDRNKIIGSTQLAFDLSLFKRPEYLLLLGYGWFSMLAYVVLLFSVAHYANEIGLDASQAALISAFLNLGQGVGRPLIGYFSDRTGRISMASVTAFLAAVFTLAIWINAKVYGVLILFAIIGGAMGGSFWVTAAPVTTEVVGLRHVGSGLNILWLSIVLPCLFSEPIALMIVRNSGDYLGAQLFVGVMFIAAAACATILRGWKVGEIKELAHITGQPASEFDREKIMYDETLTAQGRKGGRKKMLVEWWKASKV